MNPPAQDPRQRLAATLDELKARHPGVQMEMTQRPEGVVLSLIRVAPELRGQGLADAALRDLTRWADEHRQVLALNPERTGRGTGDADLRRWCRRHGFVPRTGPWETMVRNVEPFQRYRVQRRRPSGVDGSGIELEALPHRSMA
jgi:GNAT superfamily N-acetyltransferase